MIRRLRVVAGIALVLCVASLEGQSKAVWHFRVDNQNRQFSIVAIAHVEVLRAQCRYQFLDGQGRVVSERVVDLSEVPIPAGQQRVQTGTFENGASSARGVSMQWTVPGPPSGPVGVVRQGGDDTETFSTAPDPE